MAFITLTCFSLSATVVHTYGTAGLMSAGALMVCLDAHPRERESPAPPCCEAVAGEAMTDEAVTP